MTYLENNAPYFWKLFVFLITFKMGKLLMHQLEGGY